MTEYQPPSPKVRVDWTVPLWGVVGLILQGITVVWFAATMDGRVTASAARIDKVENRVAVLEQTNATIARLDERTKWIYDQLAAERR